MKDENALKGELKDIYNRVMSAKPEKRDAQKNTPQQDSTQQPSAAKQPPAQPQETAKPVTVDPKKGTQHLPQQQPTQESKTQNSTPETTTSQTQGIAPTSFAYSSKNPHKKIETKTETPKKVEQAPTPPKPTTEEKKMPETPPPPQKASQATNMPAAESLKAQQDQKPQNPTKVATSIASRFPLILGGMGAFAIVWGVIWALFFGLI